MKLSNIEKIGVEKCMLLIENLDNGEVQKIYNNKEIKSYKKIFSDDNYIIIKNPTVEQKKEIIKKLIDSGEGDITKSELTEVDIIMYIAPMLSTLQLSPNKKSDIKKMETLLDPNNRPPIINELNKELGKILNDIIVEWIEYAEMIAKMPDNQKDIILSTIEEESINNDLLIERQKIEELKEELNMVLENANI